MKEFRVIESIPSTRYYEYIVTAKNEEEAIQIVKDGNMGPIDSWDEINDEDSSSFNAWDSDTM